MSNLLGKVVNSAGGLLLGIPWSVVVSIQQVQMFWDLGQLRVAISTVSDPSRSGRVDMLTGPMAAARAIFATGTWVKSKHDMYMIRGSVGA